MIKRSFELKIFCPPPHLVVWHRSAYAGMGLIAEIMGVYILRVYFEYILLKYPSMMNICLEFGLSGNPMHIGYFNLLS